MEINKVYNENCLDTMSRMPPNFLDLTVTSPPYDNLRKYNGFEFDFEKTAVELYRTTKDGGVIVWIVSDSTVKGSETGTSFKQALYFKEIGFCLYDTMIWMKPSPQTPTERRYYDVFEYMFVLSKNRPKTVKPLSDRKNKTIGTIRKVDIRSSKETRKYKDEIRMVGDYSRRFNVWEIPRDNNKTSHPAVFPEKLARDHILSWSNEGDLVYDPFMGSGTTAKQCIENNRNYIGSEISSEYMKIIEERLSQANDKYSLFSIKG